MLPFLETLQDGKERTMRELTEQLVLPFKLTEEERKEHLPSGPQSLFYNRVAWAKTHLKNAGLIDNPVPESLTYSARSVPPVHFVRCAVMEKHRALSSLMTIPFLTATLMQTTQFEISTSTPAVVANSAEEHQFRVASGCVL